MGSFDVQCSLSGLPISYETPIRTFLVAERHRWRRSPVYVTDEWEVLTLPVRASYADYGWFDSVKKGYIFDSWLPAVQASLAKPPVDDDDDEPQEALSTPLTLDLLKENVRRERLYVRQFAKPSLVSLVMVREDVWDWALRHHMDKLDVLYKLKKLTSGICRREARKAMQYGVETHATLHSALEENKNRPPGVESAFAEILKKICPWGDPESTYCHEHPLWEMIEGVGSEVQNYLQSDWIELARSTQVPLKDKLQWASRYGELMFVLKVMGCYNMVLHPSQYGGQGADYAAHAKMHQDFAALSLAVHEKQLAKWGS